MTIKTNATIAQGEIESVSANGTVSIRNAVLIINVGSAAIPEETHLCRDRGSFLSAAQIVMPLIVLPQERIHSLPTHMQYEIRKKADALKEKRSAQ